MLYQDQLILQLNKEIPNLLPVKANAEMLRTILAQYINGLTNRSFEQLINLLYRVDINEEKIKALLKQPHQNSGLIIADLIIERLLEKIKSREAFGRMNTEDNCEEESW